ncbi:hypothetical protein ABIB86_000380 [Bradyrhizobium sp. JR1.7]|uniref:hypothetical protein n=1 Tax=unclassified Bradyrhizobium TaxID=2631580 RepID=UPI00339A0A4C
MSDVPKLQFATIAQGTAVADLATAMYSEFRALPPAVAGQVLTYLLAKIFINTQFKDSTPAQTFDVFADGVRQTLEIWERDR